MFARRIRNIKGMTLIEVLTAASVTLILSGLVVRTLFLSQDAVSHSVDKVEAVQSAREVVDKLTPLVTVTTASGGFQPVSIHLTDPEDMTAPGWLNLTTTEDFLGDEFSVDKSRFIPLNQLQTYFYRVEYEPSQGLLLLRKMSATDPDVPEPGVEPRPLAGGINGLRFSPLVNNDSVVEVQIQTEQRVNARNLGKNQLLETRASLHIPFYSLR